MGDIHLTVDALDRVWRLVRVQGVKKTVNGVHGVVHVAMFRSIRGTVECSGAQTYHVELRRVSERRVKRRMSAHRSEGVGVR